MGGGTFASEQAAGKLQGLSPRGRGNRQRLSPSLSSKRSIPAWAGEPHFAGAAFAPYEVYPRVGGGTPDHREFCVVHKGLSPRGRGNLVTSAGLALVPRSIPAWAGEPISASIPISSPRVYPRVGGGTRAFRLRRDGVEGLSPRGRGNPRPGVTLQCSKGSIPAWAGEPIRTWVSSLIMAVYPRVGGGTVSIPRSIKVQSGLSPRGRGNL